MAALVAERQALCGGDDARVPHGAALARHLRRQLEPDGPAAGGPERAQLATLATADVRYLPPWPRLFAQVSAETEVWKLSIYAASTILNAMIYRLTGRRLPGFLGDTICQSDGRLRRYYRLVGLTPDSAMHSRRLLGQAVFIGHVVRK